MLMGGAEVSRCTLTAEPSHVSEVDVMELVGVVVGRRAGGFQLLCGLGLDHAA